MTKRSRKKVIDKYTAFSGKSGFLISFRVAAQMTFSPFHEVWKLIIEKLIKIGAWRI